MCCPEAPGPSLPALPSGSTLREGGCLLTEGVDGRACTEKPLPGSRLLFGSRFEGQQSQEGAEGGEAVGEHSPEPHPAQLWPEPASLTEVTSRGLLLGWKGCAPERDAQLRANQKSNGFLYVFIVRQRHCHC